MGSTVMHAVEGMTQTSYQLVPAFGIVGFQDASGTWELCDYRACAPEGCAGSASCDALSCP